MQLRPAVLSAVALAVLTNSAAIAQTFTESVLHSFCTNSISCPDGESPRDLTLMQASDGNFYGVSDLGGTNSDGVVFKITPSGTLTTLYNFCSLTNCTDGASPRGGLIEGLDGQLYGTTFTGGATTNGTFFKITLAGKLTTLYSFCPEGGDTCPDGAAPTSSLTLGSDGNFYGTIAGVGSPGFDGDIYKITPSGTYTNLHVFCAKGGSCSDGDTPGGLVEATDGNFYGTTLDGGISANSGSPGTLFKMTPSGTLTTGYTFCQTGGVNCTDGEGPINQHLVEGPDGNLYGATEDGGLSPTAPTDAGTLFSFDPTTKALGVIYSFCPPIGGGKESCDTGELVQASPIIASDGNLYGTTAAAGTSTNGGGGTAYQSSISGGLSGIYSFCSTGGSDCTDGNLPASPLTQGSDGNLYGTTESDGAFDNGVSAGTFFKLTAKPALPAPVQLTFGSSTLGVGQAATLSWKVLNAFSNTMRQCYAFVQGSPTGAGTWTGKQTGAYSPSTKLYSGSASITPTVEATYTYALTCGGVESGFAAVTVGAAKVASQTALTATPSTVGVGQSVTLKATVTGASGTPTGSVTFSTGGTPIGSIALNGSGVASLSASTNGIPPGTYPVIATYGGSATYKASASSALDVVLKAATTTTVLAASPNPVMPPATETLTATVKRSAGTGTPTGKVGFFVNGSLVATVALNGAGKAILAQGTTGIGAGTYSVTAKYEGDASDGASQSAAVSVVVK
jgi:uncharacterized repeat protein (TIGR03803 family)